MERNDKCTFTKSEKILIALLQAVAIICFIDAAAAMWGCVGG